MSGAIADEQLVLEHQGLCGDRTHATWSDQPREGDEEVDGEDEEFAHLANTFVVTALKILAELRAGREQRAFELGWKQAEAGKSLNDKMQTDERASDA